MSSLVGIGWKVLSTVMFAIMIAMIKYLSGTVPTGQLIFSRSFFAIIPLIVVALMQGGLRSSFTTEHPWLHVRRSLIGGGAMFCWFTAIGILPLPEATAISFLAPLMVVALAAIFLKETVRIYRWTAVAAGFVGVVIILYPRLSLDDANIEFVGALLAAVSTVFMAVAGILVRKMTKTETNGAIVLYFFVSTSAMSLVSLYWGWVLPSLEVMGLLVLAGIFGGLGQICGTQAFRVTEASLLAPFDYINMLWAVIIGIILFDEFPSANVLVGGTIVIIAGMFVVYRERRLGLARKAEQRIKSV